MRKFNVSLKNKIAIVTGATRGIGREIANALTSLGCRVIATGTKSNGGLQDYLPLELADEASIAQFLLKIKELPQVDILINNAGINIVEPIHDLTKENWDKIIQVNLTGAMRLMKEVSSMMMRRKSGGKILNISSIYGVTSKAKRDAYSASKAGMLGLTRASALDLAPYNILVNALCPGFVETDLTRSVLSQEEMKEIAGGIPLMRFGQEEEIAAAAAFFCSDLNTYITGQTIMVDGGETAK